LPKESRRNYKNALDGLWRVYRQEGLTKLFSGGSTATARAVLMTVGQEFLLVMAHGALFSSFPGYTYVHTYQITKWPRHSTHL
ncbi:carrier protein, putative, partial [Ixodes scapularis]